MVIGKKGHVEVNGLTGDFPGAHVILEEEDIVNLPFAEKIGVVAQTTQPIERVTGLVERIRQRHPADLVRIDTSSMNPDDIASSVLEWIGTRGS